MCEYCTFSIKVNIEKSMSLLSMSFFAIDRYYNIDNDSLLIRIKQIKFHVMLCLRAVKINWHNEPPETVQVVAADE